MKLVKTKVAILCTSLLSLGAIAEEKAAPGTGPNPFSDCGIGAALFPNTEWAAVTSNIIWDIGTTAVTSATASPETCNGKSVETAQYIYRTYDSLIHDTARGEGEYLTAMFDLAGCPRQDQAAATSALRNALAKDVSAPDFQAQAPAAKAAQYYDAMQYSLSSHCSAIANS